MDVDDETQNDDADEDAEMEGADDDDDGDAQSENPKPPKKTPRKSTVDVAAIASEQEALAALQTNEILSLRLRKKYCAEALNFVRTLEGGMVLITQLLGSTNKAEVLESMEYFRVALEYDFGGAQVMHLVFLCCGRLTLYSGGYQTNAPPCMAQG
jgi:condensin complex subunit 1